MKLVRKLLVLLLILALCFGGVVLGMGYQRYKSAKDEISLEDKVNEVMENPDFVSYDQISADFLNAVVAIEDRRFYTRDGVDLIAIARALWTNMTAKELKEGGSTITQQVAKNLYFDNKPSVTRKIAEIFFLYDLERDYTKEEILAIYVNIIYYGDGHYGVKQASQGYFHASPDQLTLSQASLLAGLPQSPSRFQLSDGSSLAIQRQKSVLQAMEVSGFIQEEQINQALQWSESQYSPNS